MLTDLEFSKLCVKQGLPASTVAYLNRVRKNPPAEVVRSGGNAVSGFFPSHKMGETKTFRNSTVVFPALLMAEFNDRVYEVHDRPEHLTLTWVSASGRLTKTSHSPDLLLITEDEIAFEEWHTEEGLERLSAAMPARYQKTEDGGWCCPPGIEAAGKLGLKYRVRSENELNKVAVDNTLFLHNYLRPRKGWRNTPHTPAEWLKRLEVDMQQAKAAIDAVKIDQGITLEDLRKRLDAGRKLTEENIGQTADLLNCLIVAGELYVNLEKERLADPSNAHVFTGRDLAEAYTILPARSNAWYPSMAVQAVTLDPGEQILVSGTPWTVISVDADKTTLFSEAKKVWKVENAVLDEMIKAGEVTGLNAKDIGGIHPYAQDRLDRASPADLKRATHRWHMISYRFNPDLPVPADLPPERTQRQWSENFRDAELRYGCGYVGLFDNTQAKGNRTSRYTQDALDLAEKYVRDEWETYTQPSMQIVHGMYQEKCKEQGILRPVSYDKMAALASKRPVHETERGRKGSKGAYNSEPVYWTLKFNTPRHGHMPFSRAHIDHTRVDVALRSSQDGSHMPPAWLTILTCAYSRRILAVYLAFHRPNSISNMMVLR
jgi:putative transposase